MLTYSNLLNYLLPGREYKTYSVKKRKYLLTTFTLLSVEERTISIRLRSGDDRRIPRAKVEEVLSDWPTNGSSETLREELSPKNWNTSYIFGLIQAALEQKGERNGSKGGTTHG